MSDSPPTQSPLAPVNLPPPSQRRFADGYKGFGPKWLGYITVCLAYLLVQGIYWKIIEAVPVRMALPNPTVPFHLTTVETNLGVWLQQSGWLWLGVAWAICAGLSTLAAITAGWFVNPNLSGKGVLIACMTPVSLIAIVAMVGSNFQVSVVASSAIAWLGTGFGIYKLNDL